MTLEREHKLITDLIKEDQNHTIKDFLETRDEIEKIEKNEVRRMIILNAIKNGNKGIGIGAGR